MWSFIEWPVKLRIHVQINFIVKELNLKGFSNKWQIIKEMYL